MTAWERPKELDMSVANIYVHVTFESTLQEVGLPNPSVTGSEVPMTSTEVFSNALDLSCYHCISMDIAFTFISA
eukprot:829994-Amphidinium_carterae.1